MRLIAFTDEQMGLYDEACRRHARWGEYVPLDVAIHTIKGKRILCVKFQLEGANPAYMHYCPAGLDERDMTIVTNLHGMNMATAFSEVSAEGVSIMEVRQDGVKMRISRKVSRGVRLREVTCGDG